MVIFLQVYVTIPDSFGIGNGLQGSVNARQALHPLSHTSSLLRLVFNLSAASCARMVMVRRMTCTQASCTVSRGITPSETCSSHRHTPHRTTVSQGSRDGLFLSSCGHGCFYCFLIDAGWGWGAVIRTHWEEQKSYGHHQPQLPHLLKLRTTPCVPETQHSTDGTCPPPSRASLANRGTTAPH